MRMFASVRVDSQSRQARRQSAARPGRRGAWLLLWALGMGVPPGPSLCAQQQLPLIAPCFGPGMVLRQPAPSERETVVLWGWVPSRQYVSVQLPGGKLLRTEQEQDDRLRARKLDLRVWTLKAEALGGPLPTSGPFTITVRLHKSRPGETLKKPEDVLVPHSISNVVVGDVWALQVRPNRGVPHGVRTLPPNFRILRASTLAWDGRSPDLIGRIGAGQWEIPGSDPQAVAALPSLVAYTADGYFGSTTPRAAALGIILVEQDPPEDRTANLATEASAMGKATYEAYRRCQNDESETERERLMLKRRGQSTGGYGGRSLTARVDRRHPPTKGEFFYDVTGFFW